MSGKSESGEGLRVAKETRLEEHPQVHGHAWCTAIQSGIRRPILRPRTRVDSGQTPRSVLRAGDPTWKREDSSPESSPGPRSARGPSLTWVGTHGAPKRLGPDSSLRFYGSGPLPPGQVRTQPNHQALALKTTPLSDPAPFGPRLQLESPRF